MAWPSAAPTVSCLSSVRTTASTLGIIGAVCLVLVQFMSWGGVSGSFFGATYDVDAYTWHMEASGDSSFGSGSDKTNWYADDDERDEEADGEVAQIRLAIPLLLVGLVLAALGGILGFSHRGGPIGFLLLIGGILAAVGTIMFALAVDSLFDSDQDWGASFYLALLASTLILVGGVLALTPRGKSA